MLNFLKDIFSMRYDNEEKGGSNGKYLLIMEAMV